MNAEKRPSKKGQGWAEIWQSDNAKLQRAASRVNAYRDLAQDQYVGVNVAQGEEWPAFEDFETIISLELTPRELKSAPRAVRRVFRDIGVKKSDRVSLQLTLPPVGSSFKVTIIPHEITDDRIGITLSSIAKEGEVIAPVYQSMHSSLNTEPSIVKPIPFFPSSGDKPTVAETRAHNARLAYKSIAGNVDGNDLFARSHPHMIEIMTAAGNWAADLLESRKQS